MIWQVERPENGRHRMADSVREFGHRMLDEGSLGKDEAAVRARHAYYHLVYAQEHQGDYDALAREFPDIMAGFEYVSAEETWDDEAVRAYAWAMDRFLSTQGYLDERLRWMQVAGIACENLGDQAGLAATYNHIGRVHNARGEFREALEWYKKDLSISEGLEDRAGLATTYNNIGAVHAALGMYQEALEWYGKGVAIQQELGNRVGLAATCNSIGLIHAAIGVYEEALAWYEKAAVVQRELGNRAGLAMTYSNIGRALADQGRLTSSLVALEKSLALCRKLGLSHQVMAVEGTIREVRQQMG